MPPSRTPAAESSTELGSFRDPDSRVFLDDDVVYRVLSPDGWQDWLALAATPLVADDRLIPTEPVELDDLPDLTAGPAAGALKHERIPFVSYPYEWPFSMLKDAALLQLELGRRALEHDLTLKDASAYNVQFTGAQPVFVDVGSFERLNEGEPWAGYRQFCMLFLYPLMLQAYRGMPYHALLRGRSTGSRRARRGRCCRRAGAACSPTSSCTPGSRPATPTPAAARSSASSSARASARRCSTRTCASSRSSSGGSSSSPAARPGPSTAARTRTATRRPRARPSSCAPPPRATRAASSGTSAATTARTRAWPPSTPPPWSRVDADHATVDGLYRALRDEGRTDILPLVMSVTDPSPDLGWRGLERARLERRGTPDLALALALIHHVVITGNVPVREFVAWLRSLDTALVIEFPERDDPMVQKLLSGKTDKANPDYERETFERALGERFEVERTERLGSRTLYEARPRV